MAGTDERIDIRRLVLDHARQFGEYTRLEWRDYLTEGHWGQLKQELDFFRTRQTRYANVMPLEKAADFKIISPQMVARLNVPEPDWDGIADYFHRFHSNIYYATESMYALSVLFPAKKDQFCTDEDFNRFAARLAVEKNDNIVNYIRGLANLNVARPGAVKAPDPFDVELAKRSAIGASEEVFLHASLAILGLGEDKSKAGICNNRSPYIWEHLKRGLLELFLEKEPMPGTTGDLARLVSAICIVEADRVEITHKGVELVNESIRFQSDLPLPQARRF